MELNFDEKEGKLSSQSEINQLRRDLNAEAFQNIYTFSNNNITSETKKYNLEEEKNDENEQIGENNVNQNINIINNNNIVNQEEKNNVNADEKDINEKNEEIKEVSPNKEESQEEEQINPQIEENIEQINPQVEENIEQINESQLRKEKLMDLIPLWFKCLNKDHDTKYISLDRKKQNLICKYCFQNGALETNLDINQEFVDEYIKDLEEKYKKKSELSKDIIKETSEENISEKEEINNKLNEEENETNSLNINNEQINCLTFLCQNFPYYFCETCKDFICYKCIIQKIEGDEDKGRHYFHDIESVNYEANSFRDDVNINLDTLENILSSLDYIKEEEKNRIKNFRNKIMEMAKNELNNCCLKTFERLKENIIKKNKDYEKDFCKKVYENKDMEVNDLYISNNNIQEHVQNIMDELKLIKEKINCKDITNEEKCELHNKYIQLIKNANLLIEKGNSMIIQSKQILNNLNNDNIKNKYAKEESLQDKLLLDKEKSFIQSLSNNNTKKGSYILNRFVTYKHPGLSCFSFSTLEFSCNNDIILYGILLCGKYLSTNKLKEKDYSKIPINERSFYKINVKIYQLQNQLVLINENKKLYEIIDPNDPIVNINFDKSIKINKDEKYVIVVENLEEEKYCDIWMGNVMKKLIFNNVQNIRCNNTGFEFKFCLSKDYNSDFDEFKMGIIEGILYGK